jgi:hypothetical protein
MAATQDADFLTAAREGDVLKLQKLEQRGVSVDTVGHMNRSALHIAAMEGKLEAVLFLIEKKANLNAQASSGETPLHLATLNSHKNVIEVLLDEGANADAVNFSGKKAIDYARKRPIKQIFLDFASGTQNDEQNEDPSAPSIWQQRKMAVDQKMVEEMCSVGYRRAEVLDTIYAMRSSQIEPTRAKVMADLEKKKMQDRHGENFLRNFTEISHKMTGNLDQNLGQEPSSKEEDECKVCFVGTLDCVLVPCGHICVCFECSKNMEMCPMCRAEVKSVLRTYKS